MVFGFVFLLSSWPLYGSDSYWYKICPLLLSNMYLGEQWIWAEWFFIQMRCGSMARKNKISWRVIEITEQIWLPTREFINYYTEHWPLQIWKSRGRAPNKHKIICLYATLQCCWLENTAPERHYALDLLQRMVIITEYPLNPWFYGYASVWQSYCWLYYFSTPASSKFFIGFTPIDVLWHNLILSY